MADLTSYRYRAPLRSSIRATEWGGEGRSQAEAGSKFDSLIRDNSKVTVDKNFDTELPAPKSVDNNDSSTISDEPKTIHESNILDPLYNGNDVMFAAEDPEEIDSIDDYTPDPEAKTILVLPSGETIKGTDSVATLWKWHKTAGCQYSKYLLKVAPNCKGMEEVAKIRHDTQLPPCDACMRGKSQRKSPKKKEPTHRYREVMYKMHTDLSGIIQTPSLSGAKYFAVFVDDASRYRFVALLKKKSDWLKAFDALTVRLGRHPKILRGDNAKELSVHGNECKEYFAKHRVFNELCSPHEHDQNPVSESLIGALSRQARCMLINANAPKRMWGHCIQYAAECQNRFTPFMKGSGKTCWEAFHGEQPDNTFVANTVWGCRAYLHVERH